MKELLIILTLTVGLGFLSTAQGSFSWTDSTFQVGQTRNIRLSIAHDGPCTAGPCYDYGDNKQIYDTLVSFFTRNQNISVTFIWNTSTSGSSQYNFYTSKRFAEVLIKELIRLGISEKRIAATGLGESRPLINEIELKKIEDRNKRFEADRRNNRIQIIITSAPNN